MAGAAQNRAARATLERLVVSTPYGGVAQRELPPLEPDVLLVPHHGSASTDPGWLASTVGSIAVISVGPNTYGHPAPEIVAVLDDQQARVHLTLEEGDIAIELGNP